MLAALVSEVVGGCVAGEAKGDVAVFQLGTHTRTSQKRMHDLLGLSNAPMCLQPEGRMECDGVSDWSEAPMLPWRG